MPQYSVLQYLSLNNIELLKKHRANLIFYRDSIQSSLWKYQSEEKIRSIIDQKVVIIEKYKAEMNEVIDKLNRPEYRTKTQLLHAEFNNFKRLAQQEIRVYLAYKQILDDPEFRQKKITELEKWIFDADMSISFIDIAIQTLLNREDQVEEYEDEDE